MKYGIENERGFANTASAVSLAGPDVLREFDEFCEEQDESGRSRRCTRREAYALRARNRAYDRGNELCYGSRQIEPWGE